MKQKIIVVGLGLALAMFTMLFAPGKTDAVEVVTDDQIAAVKSRCTEVQATLNRLEASDKLLRHNIGSTFLILSDKLMVPLNQRIASNQLDGSGLLAITASYTKAYRGDPENDFYTAYTKYEDSLLATMRIDCVKQPTTFLDALDEARQNRLKLRQATEQLMKLAEEYKEAFDVFRETQANTKQVSE